MVRVFLKPKHNIPKNTSRSRWLPIQPPFFCIAATHTRTQKHRAIETLPLPRANKAHHNWRVAPQVPRDSFRKHPSKVPRLLASLLGPQKKSPLRELEECRYFRVVNRSARLSDPGYDVLFSSSRRLPFSLLSFLFQAETFVVVSQEADVTSS